MQMISESRSGNVSEYYRPNKWPSFLLRLFLFVLGLVAIACSIFSIYSCEFFSYRALDDVPWEGLIAPFDELAEASVGLFSYSETVPEKGLYGENCVTYQNWEDVSQQHYFYVAQWCSMVAPGVAFLGLIQIVFEWICCRLNQSYTLMRFFFLAASLLQLCSFLVFLESDFCFEPASQQQCYLRNGSLYSAVATGTYFLLGIAFILMQPYRDVGYGGRCCINTRGGDYFQTRQGTYSNLEHNEKGSKSRSETDEEEACQVDEPKNQCILCDDIPDEDDSAETHDIVAMKSVSIDFSDRYMTEQDAGAPDSDDAGVVDREDPPENTSHEDDNFVAKAPEETSDEKSVSREEERSMPTDSQTEDLKKDGEERQAKVIEGMDEPKNSQRQPDCMDLCFGDPFELENYIGTRESTDQDIQQEREAKENPANSASGDGPSRPKEGMKKE